MVFLRCQGNVESQRNVVLGSVGCELKGVAHPVQVRGSNFALVVQRRQPFLQIGDKD